MDFAPSSRPPTRGGGAAAAAAAEAATGAAARGGGGAGAAAAPANPGEVATADLAHIRRLYLRKQYKQCIAACDRHLEDQLNEAHKAFVLFQQGISYEALGHAAHKYSQTKIPFFESAEDKFTSILEILDQTVAPLISDSEDMYLSAGSPLLGREMDAFQRFATADPLDAPVPDAFDNGGSVPSSSQVLEGDDEDDDGAAFRAYTARLLEASASAAFDNSSSVYSSDSDRTIHAPAPASPVTVAPQRSSIPRTVTFPNVNEQDKAPDAQPAGSATDVKPQVGDGQHVSRLADSLGSMHLPDDDLIPEPLFSSRAKKAPATATTTGPGPASVLPLREFIETELRRPDSSPLTGQQTTPTTPATGPAARRLLPSPFEDEAPGDPNRPDTPPSALIRSVFPPAHEPPHPEEAALANPAQLLPPRPQPAKPVSRSESILHSFCLSVRAALSATRMAIVAAKEVQEEHAAAKRNAFLDAARDGSSRRRRSYWLLDAPTSPKRRVSNNKDERQDEAARQQKQERIERLRAAGWPVNKETAGYKGTEHYDALARDVDAEMRTGVGGMGVRE